MPVPKISSAEMKAAVEAFKKKFTPGFYHGSKTNDIKAFDPKHAPSEGGVSTDSTGKKFAEATFLTSDPSFANSFLPAGKASGYKPGSTVYPVSANLGKHFDYETPEGKAFIKQYLEKKMPAPKNSADINKWMSDRAAEYNELKNGAWSSIETPDFQDFLRANQYDSFSLQEAGRKNVGVFEPQNIRGKFADFNPEEAANPDFMKAAGGAVGYAGGGTVGMLNELMQLIKQQGGSAAAKRLERAADLIPNLEHKFQPQALKSAFTGDNASAVMVMKPGDFEKYAMPIDPTHKGYRIGDVYAGNHDELPKGDLDEYLKYLNSVKESGGFRDVPFLNVGQLQGHSFPNIQGHEGRHRMRALEKANEENALVRMIPTSNLREPFPRRSQEEYLDALQNKIGVKPMVKPEQTEEGVSRGLIDLPQMFAGGGNVVKKALQFAKEMPFVHYSTSPSVSRLEPGMYGTGIKGQEAKRLKDAPDIRPRSYFYVDQGEKTMRPEQGLGPHKYSGVAQDIYPLHEDPAGYSAIAKQKALDPYMLQHGREVVDQPTHLNELERLIKGAGYKGYANDDVGLLFHPTDVQKVTD